MENKIRNKVNKLIEDKEWVHKTKSSELLLLKSNNEKETLIEHRYEIGGIKLTINKVSAGWHSDKSESEITGSFIQVEDAVIPTTREFDIELMEKLDNWVDVQYKTLQESKMACAMEYLK